MNTRSTSHTCMVVAMASLAFLIAVTAVPRDASAVITELFFSEYVEGTSNNKALEIFNGTGATVDLAAEVYNVQMFFNGNSLAGLTIFLTGSVVSGDVFVLAQASASFAGTADQINGAGFFNGNDAVALRHNTTIIDVIGQIGFDPGPGTEWGSGLTSTMDNTLRRKSTVEAGDPNGSDAFDPAIQWDGFVTDDFTGLGTHFVAAPVPEPSSLFLLASGLIAVSGWVMCPKRR